MKIFARSDAARGPGTDSFPCVLLHTDMWDDFGYKTLFQAELWLTPDESVDLGGVKIMRRGQGHSATPFPLPSGELSLSADHCSLGQAASYYETLFANLPRSEYQSYLRRMRDVVTLRDSVLRKFESEHAFQTSLLRTGGAQRAFADAPTLYRGGHALDTTLSFDFVTQVGGDEFTANFRFGDSDEIPSRLNAVIGYNGVGKTRLMANLALVAWQDARGRANTRSSGHFEPNDIAFGRVVAVSYSAFDTFATPLDDTGATISKTEYVYCGLRDVRSKNQDRLKSPEEIAGELSGALDRIRSTERWASLNRALAPIFREPSFQLSATMLDFRSADWIETFSQLSTGHKISLNIVVQLVAQLENKSLVLIDEPESHLHPPLLAALMKGISEALDETNSFAIIATHSPVVLQEIAGRYVQVLRRYGTRTEIERPFMETFGENVGILTRSVFNLDNAESDYEGVLRRLGASFGYERIRAIFPDGLSSQALGIVMEAEADAAEEDGLLDDSPRPDGV